MVALLDALEIERTAVVGWSMGGFVAQSLARSAPGRVTALGLISTHTGGPDCVNGSPEVARELVDHSGTPREQATRLIGLLFPPAGRRRIRRPLRRDRRRGPGAAPRAGALHAGGSAGRLARPARVALGRSSRRSRLRSSTAVSTPWCRPATPRCWPASIPGRRWRSAPDCAHAPMAQEPEAVASAILAATAGQAAAPRGSRSPPRAGSRSACRVAELVVDRLEAVEIEPGQSARRLVRRLGPGELGRGSAGPGAKVQPATSSRIPTAAMLTPAYWRTPTIRG